MRVAACRGRRTLARCQLTAPAAVIATPAAPLAAIAVAGSHRSASNPPTRIAIPCPATIPADATPIARPLTSSGVARTKLAWVCSRYAVANIPETPQSTSVTTTPGRSRHSTIGTPAPTATTPSSRSRISKGTKRTKSQAPSTLPAGSAAISNPTTAGPAPSWSA